MNLLSHHREIVSHRRTDIYAFPAALLAAGTGDAIFGLDALAFMTLVAVMIDMPMASRIRGRDNVKWRDCRHFVLPMGSLIITYKISTDFRLREPCHRAFDSL
jgi:hypothetical protein